MKKRLIKAAAFAVLTALLLPMLMTTALAAPTFSKTVPVGTKDFSVDLPMNSGREPCAGIEFGLTLSNENALTFASFTKSVSDPEERIIEPVTKDGVHYFGFFSNKKDAYSGQYTLTLNFKDYSVDQPPVTITLTYMNVVRIEDDNTAVGQANAEGEDVYVINVSRQSSGSVVVTPPSLDIPDPETPTTGDERELYLDVTDPTLWYYDAVYYVTDYGLMNGSGNKFSPNTPVTRAMFVTILGRLAEQQGEETTGFNNPFQDVPAGQWYTQYVAWGADKDIVRGHSATRFAPNDPITREQMAALLVRFADTMDIELKDDADISFTDADAISSWAKEDVERAVAGGLMQGSNGRFRPKATANRAEAAQLFMNFVKAYLE